MLEPKVSQAVVAGDTAVHIISILGFNEQVNLIEHPDRQEWEDARPIDVRRPNPREDEKDGGSESGADSAPNAGFATMPRTR